jgi:hypothetical protein
MEAPDGGVGSMIQFLEDADKLEKRYVERSDILLRVLCALSD